MQLTVSERFALSSVLPPHGDILTLKDIRQLREELAVGQSDREAGIQFPIEFQCPKCQVKSVFPAPVKCGVCDVWMVPTGQMGCSNWEFIKEVFIPDYLVAMFTTTLKQMNDNKRLEERHIGIYGRFVLPEVPETVVKSMEE